MALTGTQVKLENGIVAGVGFGGIAYLIALCFNSKHPLLPALIVGGLLGNISYNLTGASW